MLVTADQGSGNASERQALVQAVSTLDGVLLRTVKDTNVLDVVKHTLLVISLDALDELNDRFSNERLVGHVALPDPMPASAVSEHAGEQQVAS